MQTTNVGHMSKSYSIVVSNIENGETICYSLALIKGHIRILNSSTLSTDHNLSLTHTQEDLTISESKWPVQNLEFKVLVSLRHGTNHIVLDYCGDKLTMTINFCARNTDVNVTPVYIICKGHDGRFQAPEDEDDSVESACERISIGARLIQCLTAEKLQEANLGRKTFQLAHDLDESIPKCVVLNSQLHVEQAREMESEALWEHFGRELMMSHLGNNRKKYMAFLSCTRYCPKLNSFKPKSHEDILSMMEAHVALGGGGLALFGSACLHTWPRNVGEVMSRFLNDTRVDTDYLMDDSSYRGTYGGCFSTTLGGVCHELGHTFDLGHSYDGIMGRGFDNVDLVFTLQGLSDNESVYSDDGNRNVMSPDVKDIGQHSTISFTKMLNVSYTMSSPVRRPRKIDGRSRLRRQNVDSSITNQNNQNNKQNSQSVLCSKEMGDLTFWSKSCGVLLSFHRWFNNETTNQVGVLRYEPHRKVLTSSCGVRVVEIRDGTGFVINSWEFLNARGRDTFILPTGVWQDLAHTLVAEDSAGNILKYQF